ncbi:MAG: fatty acid--CoA ligase [Alphaproteobacteria bacterium]|jgi:acyl-CoA synthetase (AMP-forming)/AMP-acid ligase II|nr:fatty acid--CoA ligase [Alphaproteobacteria bacterium]MDP6813514.1 fatty acid--CoA ligase [Alphaproteobacteria bacterium]
MENQDGYRFMADPIRRHARERGDKVALIFEDRQTTYRQLNDNASRVANGLIEAGIKPGQRVAILAKNIDVFFEIYYGASKAGAVLVPVNFRLAPPEVAFVVNDAGAEMLFVGEEFYAMIEGLGDGLTTVRKTIALHDNHLEWSAYSAWRDQQPSEDPAAEGAPSDTAIQVYSSGTTGHPKGVEIMHKNFLYMLPIVLDEWGSWDVDDVSMVAMPLFHVAGCQWGFVAFYVGGTNVLLPDVDPPAILRAVEEHRITQVLFVPAVILFLLQTPGCAETDFSSVKMVVYGASPIPFPVLQQAVEAFGCGFAQVYGLTETTGAVTYLPPEDHDGSDKMKSCGKPMSTARIRVVDQDGDDRPVGQVGEIVVAGGQIMKGYWNLPEASAEAIKGEWFHSGDAGYFDDEGYLYIHDRVTDMIISGGENIYPAEVESALAAHPKIADVAVIGVPDDRWGEAVKAIIVVAPDQELDAEEVIGFAHQNIAGYKCPKSVDFAAELPRNPSGKILKRELRKPYWQDQDRQVH